MSITTAVAAPAPLELLEVAGRDRERLLHGLTTGEVRKLAPGEASHGFFTTPQGRVLADYRLLARTDSFWLLLPRGTTATIVDHLEKYKLASEVELRPLPDVPIFELRGPDLEAIEAGATGGEIVALRDPVHPTALLLLPQAPGQPESPNTWMRKAEASKSLRIDPEAVELARIEAGELRYGVDFDGANFPQETGRDSAVSYTKGCFLGQEVVARIHYRGGVQKRPCGIRFDGDAPAAGTELALEGRAVGRATSVARSPRFGAIGLGILHQRAAAPGTQLELKGGSARVVTLPFEPL